MAEANSTALGATRHRRPVCSNCRRRKNRCDSGLPRCSTCAAGNLKCCYEKAPSMAYVVSLQQKVQKLEEKIQSLQSTQLPPIESIKPALAEEEVSISIRANGTLSYHNPTSAIHEASLGVALNKTSQTKAVNPRIHGKKDAEIRESLVTNAATQRRWEERSLELVSPNHADIPHWLGSALLKLHWCWFHPSFMFVYRPAFTRDMSSLFRDTSSTLYFSDTLLKVIYAHSCRLIQMPIRCYSEPHLNYSEPGISQHWRDRLIQEACTALAMETLNSPSITTIQALLQQSARDVGCGRSSQAWLYSGMAFRMAIDLGIHLPTDKLQNYVTSLSAEDIEIRKRLFWSLYSWDKHISLYLGRMPNFLFGAENVPLQFLDDFTETDLWEPYYGPTEDQNRTGDAMPNQPYPPKTGHIISCFTNLCKLCKILSAIMLELYNPGISSSIGESQGLRKEDAAHSKSIAFMSINANLQAWQATLPSYLRISADKCTGLSPPAHITSLNLMYHCALILLHRPYIVSQQDLDSPMVQRSVNICRTATTAIHDLLQMFVKTFGFRHITYMNSYCTYTAATIAVFQLERTASETIMTPQSALSPESVATAHLQLKFLLEVLQNTAPRMPGLYRSIDILKTKVRDIFTHQVDAHLSLIFPAEPSLPSSHDTRDSLKAQFHSSPTTDSSIAYSKRKAVPSTEPDCNFIDLLSSSQRQGLSYDTGLGADNRNITPLPAFPGQDMSIGADPASIDIDGMSPDTRWALMGSNLDPHLSLCHPAEVGGLLDLWDTETFQNM